MIKFLDEWRIKRAAEVIHNKGVIAYPTEAVYGLGCDPFHHQAVERLLKIKQRDVSKGLILIAADWKNIQPLISKVNPEILEKIRASWPGPVTWVLPASDQVPLWIRGKHNTVAIRIPAHEIARRLCVLLGRPIVSTSANVADQPPCDNFYDVKCQFGDQIDFILKGKIGGLKKPTQIRDAMTDKILRE